MPFAGLSGVDAAEDNEMCSGEGMNDEWLSSRYPETHMSQKMIIEAKRKEMERFKRMNIALSQGNPWKGTERGR